MAVSINLLTVFDTTETFNATLTEINNTNVGTKRHTEFVYTTAPSTGTLQTDFVNTTAPSTGTQQTDFVYTTAPSTGTQQTDFVYTTAPSTGTQQTDFVYTTAPSTGTQQTDFVYTTEPSTWTQQIDFVYTTAPSTGTQQMDFVYTTVTSTWTKEEQDALYMPLIVSLTVSVIVIALMAICLTVLATRGRRSNCRHSPRDYNDLQSDRVDFHKYLTCKERDAVNNIQSTMTRTSSSLYNVPQEMCQYSEICTNRVISSCYIDPIYDVKIDMYDQT